MFKEYVLSYKTNRWTKEEAGHRDCLRRKTSSRVDVKVLNLFGHVEGLS